MSIRVPNALMLLSYFLVWFMGLVFLSFPLLVLGPSGRCASAANVVCRDFDVFRNHNVSLEHILL
jgi:hypothetical protein